MLCVVEDFLNYELEYRRVLCEAAIAKYDRLLYPTQIQRQLDHDRTNILLPSVTKPWHLEYLVQPRRIYQGRFPSSFLKCPSFQALEKPVLQNHTASITHSLLLKSTLSHIQQSIFLTYTYFVLLNHERSRYFQASEET